jgi:hypothetical protein
MVTDRVPIEVPILLEAAHEIERSKKLIPFPAEASVINAIPKQS